MRTFSLVMTIVLSSLGVGQTPVAQGGFVTFTPIDFPGATETIALDINDVGEIVGRYVDAAGTHGFLLSAGNFTSIDFPHPDVVFTVAAGINPRGDIVGQYSLVTDPPNTRHGFLSHAGTFTTIKFPDINTTFTNILGINPRRDMVGRYCLAFAPCMPSAGNARGFLRSMQGGFATIDVPGALETHAWKINAHGQIVGNYQDSSGTFHVYLRRQGAFTSIDFPHAVRTIALGINTRGHIVGLYEDTSGNTHGFLLSQYERDGDEDER
jgi:probable HAF family extracellular repeat protein